MPASYGIAGFFIDGLDMTEAFLSARIIDGVALSQTLRADVAARAHALKARGITPGLAVILVGDNPASQVYVRNRPAGPH